MRLVIEGQARANAEAVKWYRLRNRRTVDLVTSEKKLKKLAAQPSFKQFKILNENLVAVERAKVELTFN